jgi:acyltransferase-like protein
MYKPMFVPPRHHPVLVPLARLLLPYLSGKYGIRGIRLDKADFARLEELRPHRAILAPNHPTGNDPIVLMWLSRRLGQPFNYLAAREVLDGPKGWAMNQLGAYSVIRGGVDRESIRMTRSLLAEMDRKVVIFPEGEVYEHNDTLLSFQSGVIQLGFWALDDLVKLKKDPALPVLPIAIKYRCLERPGPLIRQSLTELERAVKLAPDPKLNTYQRLLRIGDRMLATVERDIGIQPDDGKDRGERIRAYRQKLLENVARAIGSEIDTKQAPQEQIHRLYYDLRNWVGLLPEDASAYDEVLHHRRQEIAEPLFLDIERLQNFIAVTGDYIAAEATAERFLDVLGRLEEEVFGEVRHRGSREALVRIASPIRLEERYDEYRENKRKVVADVTRQMEGTIRELLRELSRQATPIAMD